MIDNLNLSISAKIKLSILRALLSEINPSLRAIAFEWSPIDKKVITYFYHEGEINDAIENHYSCIECEASTHFYYDNYLFDHDFKILRLDLPKKLPKHEFWVYIRKEPFVDPSDD